MQCIVWRRTALDSLEQYAVRLALLPWITPATDGKFMSSGVAEMTPTVRSVGSPAPVKWHCMHPSRL